MFLPWNAKHFSPTPHFKSFYSVSVRLVQSPSLHSILEYFITLTFVAVFIFLSFQILASTTAFCLANTMPLLVSFVQSPSADLYDPRNLKSCTCSSHGPLALKYCLVCWPPLFWTSVHWYTCCSVHFLVPNLWKNSWFFLVYWATGK